jgi:hypothetical protein
MKSFKAFLLEQDSGKNLHMTHLEDHILTHGVEGARQAIHYLLSLRDMLSGHTKTSINVSVKWDGAPAVFAGIDPEDGKFFVAKKALFSGKQETYKIPEDVDNAGIKGDLNVKLKLALKHLPSLNIKSGVIQGDFLYAKEDLKTIDIEGVPHISFHPNTIVYAVPKDSELGKTILASQMGIVWHTEYSGKTLKDMKASFGKEINNKLSDSKTVWSRDAVYKDVSGTATFTKKETDAVNRILTSAGKSFQKLNRKTIDHIANDDELRMRIMTFLNSKVRQGEKVGNTKKFVDDLIDWTIKYYMKKVQTFKTEKRQNTEMKKASESLKYFTNIDKKQVVMMFDIYNDITMAKQIIIKKLDKARTIGTFILTDSGLRATGHEGFVAIDHTGKNAVKLVDRMEFSKSNFSSDVIKGWDK